MIIINADDFGMKDNKTIAIDYCFTNGIIDQASIMVNCDSFDKAINLAKEHGYLDKLRLHVNLTSGVPLTKDILSTPLCKDGAFSKNNLSFLRKGKIKKNVSLAIIHEIEAQMNKYINSGCTLLQVDSHHHVHTFPSMRRIIIKCAKNKGFVYIRLSNNIYPNNDLKSLIKCFLKRIANNGILHFNSSNSCFRIKYFTSLHNFLLLKKKKNDVELMVHPNFDDNVLFDDSIGDYSLKDNLSLIKLKKG